MGYSEKSTQFHSLQHPLARPLDPMATPFLTSAPGRSRHHSPLYSTHSKVTCLVKIRYKIHFELRSLETPGQSRGHVHLPRQIIGRLWSYCCHYSTHLVYTRFICSSFTVTGRHLSTSWMADWSSSWLASGFIPDPPGGWTFGISPRWIFDLLLAPYDLWFISLDDHWLYCTIVSDSHRKWATFAQCDTITSVNDPTGCLMLASVLWHHSYAKINLSVDLLLEWRFYFFHLGCPGSSYESSGCSWS